MPYKNPAKQAQQQRDKWVLWREMRDGFADEDVCKHCGLPIFALDESRFTITEPRWHHFVDPKALGIRPLGKNDPVYDLVRRCDVALKHRYIPEGFEDHSGEFQGFDPRVGATRDIAALLQPQLDRLGPRCVAEP